MLVALPIPPSFGLDPIVPYFSSLFSASLVTSALKSSRNLTAEFRTLRHQPNYFPLFPHPANIARAATLVYPERPRRGANYRAATAANPFGSIVYSTFLWIPPGWGARASLLLRPHSTSRPKQVPGSPTTLNATFTRRLAVAPSNTHPAKLSPLGATLTKIIGGPRHGSRQRPARYSLPTTHYSPSTTHHPLLTPPINRLH
jgi:hypothetical protein